MKLEAGETYRLRVIDSKKAIPDEVGLTLLVGLLKAEQFDAVLRASSELGVRTILPVLCERSVPRIPPSESNKKISRWQRILDEGTYVSGSIFPPKIESPVPFGDIAWDKLPEFRYAAVIASGSRPIAGISGVTGEIVFAVGPEGDWSDGERAELLGKNFVPVLLGNRIMRASTAVITGLGWFRLCSSR
jgi:16S rRNA (uracil1498-N3)-methyltransferase